jgi:hypothetical protein
MAAMSQGLKSVAMSPGQRVHASAWCGTKLDSSSRPARADAEKLMRGVHRKAKAGQCFGVRLSDRPARVFLNLCPSGRTSVRFAAECVRKEALQRQLSTWIGASKGNITCIGIFADVANRPGSTNSLRKSRLYREIENNTRKIPRGTQTA